MINNNLIVYNKVCKLLNYDITKLSDFFLTLLIGDDVIQNIDCIFQVLITNNITLDLTFTYNHKVLYKQLIYYFSVSSYNIYTLKQIIKNSINIDEDFEIYNRDIINDNDKNEIQIIKELNCR